MCEIFQHGQLLEQGPSHQWNIQQRKHDHDKDDADGGNDNIVQESELSPAENKRVGNQDQSGRNDKAQQPHQDDITNRDRHAEEANPVQGHADNFFPDLLFATHQLPGNQATGKNNH